MNAPFDLPKAEADHFEAELQRANSWRGECIQEFAALEQIIADALESLAAAKPSMKIKQGEFLGTAFNELKRVIGAKGALAKTYGLSKSVVEIDRLIGWRGHLTHGVMSVWRGKGGKWLLAFQHRDPGGGPLRMHTITRCEADEFLAQLADEVERLRSRVGHLRADHPAKLA